MHIDEVRKYVCQALSFVNGNQRKIHSINLSNQKFEGEAAKHWGLTIQFENDGVEKRYEDLKLFAKVGLTDNDDLSLKELQNEFMQCVCQNETIFYGQIVPALQRLSMSKNILPLPTCHLCLTDNNMQSLIVLEDAQVSGFKCRWAADHTIPKREVETALKSLGHIQALAELHATNMNKSLQQLFGGCLYDVHINTKDAVNSFELRQSYVDGLSKYLPAEKSKVVEDFILSKYENYFRRLLAQKSKFEGLQHNDFHAGNILHRGSDKDMEAMIIDWQAWGIGSIAWNIANMLVTSMVLNDEVYADLSNYVTHYLRGREEALGDSISRVAKWDADELLLELKESLNVGYLILLICTQVIFKNIPQSGLEIMAENVYTVIKNTEEICQPFLLCAKGL